MSGTGRYRPPPLGGHLFTKFDKNRALIFGGRTEGGRRDDTYIFDLDNKVMSFTSLMKGFLYRSSPYSSLMIIRGSI